MKSKRSAAFLIVMLLLAAALAGGLYFLIQKTDFSFLSRSAQHSAAETPPVETISPDAEEPEASAAPDTFVISMIGDCTLASSQYNADYEAVLDAHDRSWPFSGTEEFFAQDEFTLASNMLGQTDQIWSAPFLTRRCPPLPCFIFAHQPPMRRFCRWAG